MDIQDDQSFDELSNRANAYAQEGNLDEAAVLLGQALEMTTNGSEHSGDRILALLNLGTVLVENKDFEAALKHYSEVVNLCGETPHELETAEVATRMNKVVAYLLKTQNFVAARPLITHVLQIREKVLGRDHLDTASSLGHMAGALFRTGDQAGAKEYMQKAMNVYEALLGTKHAKTVQCKERLAQFEAAGAVTGASAAASAPATTMPPEHEKVLEKMTAVTIPLLAEMVKARIAAGQSQEKAFEVRLQYGRRLLETLNESLGTNYPWTKCSVLCAQVMMKQLSMKRSMKDLAPEMLNLCRMLGTTGSNKFFKAVMRIPEGVLEPGHAGMAAYMDTVSVIVSGLQAMEDTLEQESL